MKDFYALTAFFRNNTVPILDNSTNANSAPVLIVPLPQDRDRWLELEEQVAQKQEAIALRKQQAQPLFESWLATSSNFIVSGTPLLLFPLNEAEPPYHGTVDGKPIEWTGSKEQRPAIECLKLFCRLWIGVRHLCSFNVALST